MRQSPTAAPPARFPRKPSRSEHDTRPSGVGPPTRDGDPLRRLWRPGLPHGWVFRRMWSSLSDWPVQRLAPSLALPARGRGEDFSSALLPRWPASTGLWPVGGCLKQKPSLRGTQKSFPPAAEDGGSLPPRHATFSRPQRPPESSGRVYHDIVSLEGLVHKDVELLQTFAFVCRTLAGSYIHEIYVVLAQ